MNALKARGASLGQQLRSRWRLMLLRDRMIAGLVASLALAAVVWWLALAPALTTWRQAPDRHAVLDAQIEYMRALAEEAHTLQKLPVARQEDSRRALEALVGQTLGRTGTLTVRGDRATVVLTGTSAEALAALLVQTRQNARVLPIQAELVRNTARTGWDGNLTLALPQP